MSNQQMVAQKPKFSVQIQSTNIQNLINNTLGDKQRAARFVGAISSAVATNPALQECDANTIITAGLVGEALNLSPSVQLGQYYLVPFRDNKNDRTVAQFQLGYKGYIQLAIRSGQYKKLNVLPIKAGELVSFNPLTEEIVVNLIQDERQREQAETIGYYAMFEYINGFTKAIYWSREKMEAHAQRYSKGYAAHKGYTFWEKDFDAMAMKTMLRQLISKWGIMSIDIQKAYESDMAVIGNDMKPTYAENDEPIIIEQAEPTEAFAQPERTTETFTQPVKVASKTISMDEL